MTTPVPIYPDVLAPAKANPEAFRPGFIAWLADNLHVWAAFRREANRIWNRGRRHYSARTIGEVLRHESALSENGSEWKLNNTIFPDLARLYLLAYPRRQGFFELRTQANSERVA